MLKAVFIGNIELETGTFLVNRLFLERYYIIYVLILQARSREVYEKWHLLKDIC